MGYHQAGFDEIVGIDHVDQPNYPFEFYRWDATKLDPMDIRKKFDAIHASPPCQAFTLLQKMNLWHDHPDHVSVTRSILEGSGLPWIIENVPGSPLFDPIVLCGSSFGLRVRRHRLFEANFRLRSLSCNHEWQNTHKRYPVTLSKQRRKEQKREVAWRGHVPVYGGSQLSERFLERRGDEFRLISVAMGIDWMTKPELNQAIPPAYTFFLGTQLLKEVRR